MARPRQVSDTEILGAARAVFLEEGAAASVSKIADRVSLSQAALFKRFGCKQDLLIAAMAPLEPLAWKDDFAAGPDERPVREQLVELTGQIQGYFREMFPRVVVMQQAGCMTPDLMRKRYPVPPPLQAFHKVRAWFERALERGLVRDCDPGAAATMLIGSAHARGLLAMMRGALESPEQDEAYMHAVADNLWRGVRATGDEA